MKIGLYFVYTQSDIGLSPLDLINALLGKNITVCVPNWLEHQPLLNDFQSIHYLPPADFFKLDNHFVFSDENVFCNSLLLDKNICFVIERLDIDFSNIIKQNFSAIDNIKKEFSLKPHSILSLYHKELLPPFDSLFTQPQPKYRNCYIINDALISLLDNFEFDPKLDIAIPYAARTQQKMTYEKIHNCLLSPADSKSSFSQALLAENIYFEPDFYDLFIVSIALKELAYTSKTYRTHNPTLKKLKLFSH